eukprot:COSAG02_NODE_40902_length_400_cov_0.807309_1_plen_31_part_10
MSVAGAGRSHKRQRKDGEVMRPCEGGAVVVV